MATSISGVAARVCSPAQKWRFDRAGHAHVTDLYREMRTLGSSAAAYCVGLKQIFAAAKRSSGFTRTL